MNKVLIFFTLVFLYINLTGCDSSEDEEGANNVTICPKGIQNINLNENVLNQNVLQGSIDCYSFDAQSGVDYTISVETHSGDADLRIYSESSYHNSSTVVSSSNGGTTSEEVIFTASATKKYYIGVPGFEESNYSLYMGLSPLKTCSYYGVAQGCSDTHPYSCPNSSFCSIESDCSNLTNCN